MSTDIWTGANDLELREVQRLAIEDLAEAQSDHLADTEQGDEGA